MIRVLPVVVELALLIFCVIQAIQTPSDQVRNLPKWAWILLILFFPLVGGVAWLIAGRPIRRDVAAPDDYAAQSKPAVSTRDIDERLAADLARLDEEHEDSLRRWEAELRAKEEQAGTDEDGAPTS